MPDGTDLERQRDVLQRVLSVLEEAFVVWDEDLGLVLVSPAAQALLASALPSGELAVAAAAALRELGSERRDARRVAARPLRRAVSTAGPDVVSAEFSCVRASDDRRWLVAKLRRVGVEGKLATLTRAEGEVLRRLIRGGSNREIAAALCVSTETIRTHVSRILGKLDVNSRAKAASLAREAFASGA